MKPFMLGQSFSRLDPALPVAERKRHVCGHVGDEQASRGQDPQADPWKTIDRTAAAEMAAGAAKSRRVAIACDAGLGKTTNVQWLQSRVARAAGCTQVPLVLRLDDADKTGAPGAPHVELVEKEADAPGSLLDWWAGRVAHRTGCYVFSLKEHLRHLQGQGGITLLIDGLDHALSHEHFAEALNTVLTSDYWGNCPIWVAGRPYAFERCWDTLFADTDWQYLRVNPLGKAEIRQYLHAVAGVDAYEDLAHSHDLLAVPRLLHLICGIVRQASPSGATADARRAAVRALDLRTPADVYRHAYFTKGTFGDPDTHGLLAQGLIGAAARIGLNDKRRPNDGNFGKRITRMGDLVGAIAFSMAGLNPDRDVPEPVTAGVESETLLDVVGGRVESAGVCTADDFDGELDLLQQMNNFTLDHLLFRDAGGKRWVFHDRTVQAFFAAYWAMKRGTDADRKQLREWVVGKSDDPLTGYVEFWQFAAEMPDPLADRTRWLETFRPSYAHPHSLRGTAGEIQWHRRSICWSHRNMEAWEPNTVAAWRKESAALEKELAAGWKRCPADDSLVGQQEFRMGSPETEEGRFSDETPRQMRVSPFRLQAFVVTNAQYERFDPKHPREKKISDHDDQPVVNVTFWDAWCFAYWAGHRLPTEAEWEYACRAGTTTRYNFGDEPDAKLLNFESKVGRTTIQGEYPANGWGLFDMHGNVWEWCDSRSAPGTSSRILRGGSWDSDGGYCRSAHRGRPDPENRNQIYGFRLAAVPDVGAESCK